MSRFSSFKQYVFSNLFPYYYKDYDTYKDANGKGILERFVEVCSEYFDNEVVPEIDNILDNIDVDICKDLYLNYLWEFLGEIPYSNTYNNKIYPNPNPRQVLRYAISLFKIRGTALFYEVLGRLYDTPISIEIVNPPNPQTPDSDGIIRSKLYYSKGSNNQVLFWYGQYMTYPFGRCNGCVHVKINLDIPYYAISSYIEKNGWYYDRENGKVYEDSSKDVEIPLSTIEEVNSMVNVIKKYLPINTSIKVPGSTGADTDKDNLVITVKAVQLIIQSPPVIPQQFSNGSLNIPSL